MKPSVFFLLTLLAGCTAGPRVVSDQYTGERTGVFVSNMEYSYFKSSDGSYFQLSLPNAADQTTFATLVRATAYGDDICLGMRLRGAPDGRLNDVDRPFLVVSKIIEARKIKCRRLD